MKLPKRNEVEVDSVPLALSTIVTLKANEAGCVHICEGLKLDYVGVIIGYDLKYMDLKKS